jgi:putative ABC transport system permease protein
LRVALGAGPGQVIRQLLVESFILAAFAGLLGAGVAVLGVRALVALGPPDLPRIDAIHVNGTALVFALVVTTAAGLLVGLAPAVHVARGSLHIAIGESSRRTVGSRRRTRGLLVVSEVALALMLLVGSGLMLRSMSRLLAISPGFDAEHLLTMQVQAGGPRFTSDTVTRAFFDQVLSKVRALPGVDAAALTSQLPLSGDFDSYGVHIESKPRLNPEEDPSAHRYAVSPGYVETMRIPVVRGRAIESRDGIDAPPVVLVSETFARRAWPNEDAIGQRVRIGSPSDGPWRTIVGIVGDVKQVSLSADQPFGIYIPETQWPSADDALTLVLRTRGEPAAMVPAVRSAVWSVDKDQPIVRVATMQTLVSATAAQRRFTLVLFEIFALVALLLAAAGIYGVLSGSVTERLREIGVRTALGASRRNIVALVMRQGLSLIALGSAAGLLAAAALARLIAGLLFGVSHVDPSTYAAVTALFAGVGIAACLIPAWRAARVDPMVTLRAE